jgi:hypothetical protein
VEVAGGFLDPFREKGCHRRVKGIVLIDRHDDRERRDYGR